MKRDKAARSTAVRLAHLMHRAASGKSESGGREVPLLIAHGLYGSARNFNGPGRRLAKDRDAALVDMRNHGDSPWDADTTYPAMAADLAEAVERLCGGRAAVLGHSMGGKAAMALALDRPDLVAGAIVVDIAPVAYDHSHEGLIDAMLGVDLSQVARRSDAGRMMEAAVANPTLRSFLLQNLVIVEGTARWRLNLKGLKAGFPHLVGWPDAYSRDGRAFGGPCLFVHGTASDYVKPEMETRIRALFPRAEFAPIHGAGHWLHADKPEAFLAAVSDFLDNLV